MPRCVCGTYISTDSETEEEEDEWEDSCLKEWKEENKKFVPTKASELVESKLHLARICIVGETGCGKTAIAKNIAFKYAAQKWDIVDVKNINNIKNANISSKSVLFIVNDPIGKSDIDEKLFRLWHLQKEILDDYCKKNKDGETKGKLPKVIVTCRSNLLKNDREFIMSGFTIINLDEDEVRLTKQEKTDILKRHIDCSELENKELNQLLLVEKSFPLLSSIVSTSKNLQENILKFFSQPFEQLKREILLLKENSKEKYLCLLLLILLGNRLSKHSFHDEDRESLEDEEDNDEDKNDKDDDNDKDDEDEDDEDETDDDEDDDDEDDDDDDEDDDDDDENVYTINDDEMLNDLFETLKLSKSISRIALMDCLKSLRGQYFLRRIRRIFQITNDSFLLALTNIFCTDVPEQFLKYCCSSFFRTSTTCSVPENQIFPKIQLVDRFVDPFLDRIEDDIKNGTYLDVFLCPWIRDDRVLTKLLMRLKTKPYEEMEKLTLYSKLDQDNDLQILKPWLRKNLQGYSRLDLIPLCHEISPIILMLVLNIDKLFSAIFSLVKENQSSSEYFRNAPLMSACSVNGRKEFAEQVLEVTDFKNACWSRQENIFPIHIAANFLNVAILSLILNEECDVNMLMQNNESPLFLAAAAGKYNLQNISWARNVKFSDPSKTLDEVLEEKRMQALILLVGKGANVNIHPVELPTALAFTCQTQNVDIVRLLLDNGANVNDTGKNKVSPLHFASEIGNLETVQLLLDKGADVHMRTEGGYTPLYFASLNGYDAVVELLLSKGAFDELKEETGYTPFFVACKHGHTNIVKMFLKHDPCVNCTLASGTSAVLVASKNGHEKIVDSLLKNGADVNIVQKSTMIGPLFSAASRGYVQVVELLLNYDLDINLRTKKEDTPLIAASKNGHFLTVHLLIKNKANVNQANNVMITPLHMAAQQGHHDIVSLLLENNADVDACSKSGATPLIFASGRGYRNVVQELLNHGADVNKSNRHGNTALFVASEHGHIEIVKILLAKKADVNLCSKNEKSPLFIALEFGYHEIVKELLCHGSNVNGAGSKNPLLASSYSGHEKTVALLIENGAEINVCDDEGNSALMNASRRGWINVVKLLLKNDADVDICDDEDDQNALDMACFMGHSDIVKLLLDHGMDINNNGDNEKYTPLQQSLEGNRLSTALLLLDRGADVNTVVDGSTALFLACSAGLKEVVDILLERKADVNPKNSDGSSAKSPLYAAVEEGDFQIVKVLLQCGADANYSSSNGAVTVLMKAAQKNNPSMVKLLIENGANVNSVDKYGNTALYISVVDNYNVESLSILLNNNADVNVRNPEGTTPLMMALDKFDSSKFVQALVDHGADVNARDKKGQPILHLAAGWYNGHKGIPFLLKHGADVNARNENGETALHEASYVGSYKSVKALIEHGANGTLRSKAGLSPLHIAKRERHEQIIRILSEKFGGSDFDKEVVLARNNPRGPALPRKSGSMKFKKTWR